MESSKVKQLLEEPEGTNLEFKKSLEFPEAIGRTICAFANTFGGYLIIGAEKKGEQTEVTGVKDADEAFQKLTGILSQIRPKPYHQPIEHEHEGRTLIIVRVEPLPPSEVSFLKKTAYRRTGSVNEEISGHNLVKFLQQRGTVSFEENKSAASIAELDKEKINRLLERRGIDSTKYTPIPWESLLGSLGVAHNIGEFYLKNVAVLFFANDIKLRLMNSEVRIVKYRGKEKRLEAREYDERFIDTLPELLECIFKTIKEKTGNIARIIDGKRVEQPMIPDEVLREVLTNAVGHRDYFDPNGILMEIFDDRIEITNPGSLLPGITINNFSKTKKHRNPITYTLLNYSKWGEGLNLGIRAIYRALRENKLPDPEFENLGGMFKVTLFGPLSSRKARFYGVIAERQKKAIEYLKTQEYISAPKYAKLAGISHPTAITDLNDLVTRAVLKRIGRYRSSKYLLLNTKA